MKKDHPLSEYVRFGVSGVLNTLTDFAVINILVIAFEATLNNVLYTAFRVAGFIVAAIQSYFLNKYWVFKKNQKSQTAEMSKERGKFASVTIVSFLLNVTSSSIIYSLLSKMHVWNTLVNVNVSSAVGIGLVFMSNFIGYKFFVFKTTPNTSPILEEIIANEYEL